MSSAHPAPPVTLQSVATRSGVSISTASRCLSGVVSVSHNTKLRVLAAAAEVGYQHNVLVNQVMRATRRGLNKNYLGTIAYVTPFDDKPEWKATLTLCKHWNAASAHAESFGFSLAEFSLSSQGMTGRRLGGILQARGISGILLAAFPREPFPLSLPWDDFAIVPVGHRVNSPRLDCVVSDHTEAVLTAARAIAARGYRRVGLAIDQYQDQIINGRWSFGYAGVNAMVPDVTTLPPFLPKEMNRKEFLSWVEKHSVDCVFTLSTFRNQPNEMEKWLTEDGRRIPHDVGLVSLDLTTVNPDWAGIEQNSLEIGKAAVDMLFAKLRAGERGVPVFPRTLQVHGQWKHGRTIR